MVVSTSVPDPDSEARLRALGLSFELLTEAVLQGDYHARSCSPFDPPLLAGILRWAKTVGALGELLVPRGWTTDNYLNFATVVSPDGALAVAVATGNEATGKPGAEVTTRHPRGRVAREVTDRNEQLTLFYGPGIDRPSENISRTGRVTYLLLVHATAQHLQVELSRPKTIGPDGRPIDWADRIYLEPIDRGQTPKGEQPDPPSDFDVDVRRK